MKSVFISLLVLLVIRVPSSKAQDDCQDRDEAAAVAQDSTRTCRQKCTDEADCTSVNKNCLCDDLCGLSCYNPDAECPDLAGTLANGTVTLRKSKKAYGDVAMYTCVISYYLEGVSKRICRSTREWSHTAPSCNIGCPRPGAASTSYADIDLNSVGFKVGTIITHICRTGYQTTEINVDMTTTCLNTFLWSAKQFVCVKQFCGHPGTITNGELKGDSFEFGDSVTYECDPGYNIDGAAIRQCQAGPEWTPNAPLPKCEPLTCPAPAVLENGAVDDTFASGREFNDEITYSCNAGHKLNGSKTGKCNEDGNWGLVPKCVLNMDCNLEDHASGTCAYTIVSGSFVREQVTQSSGFLGYALVGDGVLRSQAYPLVGDNTTCISFEFKTPNGDLVVNAINSAGTSSKWLYSAPVSDGWKSDKFLVSKLESADNDVLFEFNATSSVTIDNILQVVDPVCASKYITTTTTTTTTAATTISTTTVIAVPTVPTTHTVPTDSNAASSPLATTTTANTTSTTTDATTTQPNTGVLYVQESANKLQTTKSTTQAPESGLPTWMIIVIVLGIGSSSGGVVIVIKYKRLPSGKVQHPELDRITVIVDILCHIQILKLYQSMFTQISIVETKIVEYDMFSPVSTQKSRRHIFYYHYTIPISFIFLI